MEMRKGLQASHSQRRNHTWIYEQRVCMHMIWTNGSVKRNDRARIFNEIFKDNGLPPCGVKLGAMESEYSKRNSTVSSARHRWRTVYEPPQTEEDRRMRARLRASIEALMSSDSDLDTVHLAKPSPPTPVPDLPEPSTRVANAGASRLRKRSAAALSLPITTAYEDFHDERLQGRKRQRHNPDSQKSVVVMIPRVVINSEDITPTTGPFESSTGVVPYPRLGNDPVMLSPTAYRNAPPAGAAYTDVSERDAHPIHPELLWRFWDGSSHGTNLVTGFKSGRSACARAPLRGPPLCKDLEWTDVLEHLNPNQRLASPIPSPFISTSSRLVWIIRLALRKQSPSSRISVIDPSILDSRTIYYVRPFHDELKKHLVFDSGAQYYKGISEHLIWNEIPQAAMVNTFTLSELCKLTQRNPDLKRLLRLNKVGAKGPLDKITRALKSDNVKITDKIAVAMAVLVMFFGLDHNSSQKMLSRMVYEVAQGWALTPDGATKTVWQARARWFTHTICRESEGPVSFAEQSKIYYAFLDGLRWSRGDVNVRQKGPEARDLMQRRTAKIGLERPAQLVIDELASSMRKIQGYVRDQ